MRKVQFKQIGTGESGMNKKGTEYIHLVIDPVFISKIEEHDWKGIYVFANKNGDGTYAVFAPVKEENI